MEITAEDLFCFKSNSIVAFINNVVKNPNNIVYSSQPADTLKNYILNTIQTLTDMGVQKPVLKFLVKTKAPTGPNSLYQSIGQEYIDLANAYKNRFGQDFVSVTELIEDANANLLNQYYSESFKGLTQQIRDSVKVLYPIMIEYSPGELGSIDIGQIESIDRLCLVEGDSCNTVDTKFYDVLSSDQFQPMVDQNPNKAYILF